MTIIIVPNEPNPNMTGRHYGIAKALIRQGHEVHTLMWDLPHQMKPGMLFRHLFTSWRTRTYTYEDLHMHKIGRLPLFWPYVNGWLFKRQLRKIYRETGAAIIFAESFTNETDIPADLPFIFDLADDYAAVADVYGSAFYKFAFKILGVQKTMDNHCRNALAVTAVSDVLCNYAERFSAHVTKLPNGVETDIITSMLSKEQNARHNPHSMIYVSGFGPWSRPVEVMNAVKTLRKDYPAITLTLVGEGSEVGAIEQFIKDNNASDYIDYRGFIHDRAKVFELISQHAIGLNISDKNKWRDAAHPMKVIEYSALGKTVVSTNLAGVEALGLPNVFMFNPNKQNDLLHAIRNALQAKLATSTYTAVSSQVVREYAWASIMRTLEQVISTALERFAEQSVVHVTPAYPPNLGGLEKVVQVLGQTQAKLGLRVRVITSDKGLGSTPPNDKLPVKRLKSFVVANTTIMPALFTQLLRVRKEEFVHLHVTQAFTPEMVWLASKVKSFSYVAHIHLDVPPSGSLGFLLKGYKAVILKRVLHHAAMVVVPTNDYRQLIITTYSLPEANVTVIPNATDHIPVKNPKTKPHKPLRILFVGRLNFQKNIPLLLEALSYCRVKFKTPFILTIVGEGELKISLEQIAKNLNIHKSVTFVGQLSGKTLEDTYANADLFVLSSIAESFGIVLVEAMTKGLPIVSTDIPAVRDVVKSGKNGILVAQEPEPLAVAIHRFSSNNALYARTSAANILTARHYRWDNVTQQFITLYSRVLAT